MVRKYFFYHSTDKNFVRKIVRFTNSSEDFDKCLLIYFFKNESTTELQLKLTVHGNSRHSTSFQCRSSGRLMEEVKQVSQMHGSLTDNYNTFVKKKIPEASLSEIPKNRKQVANQKYLISKEDTTYFDSKDELHDAVMWNTDGEFVRSMDILFNTFRAIVFTHQQVFDLCRFCAVGNSVCNIDTTFKIGNFYVSLMVFRNLSLINPRTSKHPLYLGFCCLKTYL